MTTSSAEKLAGHGVEKKDEKVEKRRALGRGLGALLPGPRVVVSPELRVPSNEPAAPQGLKPESFSVTSGTAEAVPFPVSSPAMSSGGAGETEIPRFARNDKSVGWNDRSDSPEAPLEPLASQELHASRTGVSDPHGPGPHPYSTQLKSPLLAKDARNGAPTFEDVTKGIEEPANEGISILAVAEDGGVVGNRISFLPIEVIDKNPYQTRYVFDEETLWELRDSIKEHGVVQPVVVRPAEEDGRYILVLGERRLRASKMAGKETIPAMVRRLSPQQAAEMTVLENIAREDLNPLEQAEAFRVLSVQFGLTQEQIAERIGLSRETVSNYMRLLRLPRKVMDYLLSDRLSFSDCREILRLANDAYIESVADEVVEHKLNWDQIEDRVMRINGSFAMLPGQTLPGEKKKRGGGARWMDPNVRAAQTDMERTLGMRVRIRDRHGKGRIVIEYTTVDDYEKVTGLLRSKK
jgi:ParB family transcriptional regulator, chromosome partitioning protein